MTSGRRPGDTSTKDAILAAAKRAFAAQGYAGTSVRSIARSVGVDPSLVLHFYGSKAGLFEASLALPIDPEILATEVLKGPEKDLGERIIRTFLLVWDGTPQQGPMLAMLRSAVAHEDSSEKLREILLRRILLPVALGAGGDQPERRAALLASQIIGLAMTRYVLKLEPIASAGAEDLAPVMGKTLQRYLTGPLP